MSDIDSPVQLPTYRDAEDALQRVRTFVHRTPVMRSSSLDALVNAEVFLKCEHLQRGGAFKLRGATNAIAQLTDDEKLNGVITHSSGNHAQAVALAAKQFGLRACVVMPSTAPQVKVDAVRAYGADIVFCEPTHEARERVTDELIAETGARLIHPYDDAAIIAGQATAAMELLDEVGALDVIFVPISGGGLTAGTAVACSGCEAPPRVMAVEPDGADDAYRSMQSGALQPLERAETIADGLRATLGTLPFAVMREHGVEVLCVSDEQIVDAMSFVWQRMKQVVEPSGAVGLAGLMYRHHEQWVGKRVGVLLSGGNVDVGAFFAGLGVR